LPRSSVRDGQGREHGVSCMEGRSTQDEQVGHTRINHLSVFENKIASCISPPLPTRISCFRFSSLIQRAHQPSRGGESAGERIEFLHRQRTYEALYLLACPILSSSLLSPVRSDLYLCLYTYLRTIFTVQCALSLFVLLSELQPKLPSHPCCRFRPFDRSALGSR
jgi:hypothetical protein